jgi:hypothetical protein
MKDLRHMLPLGENRRKVGRNFVDTSFETGCLQRNKGEKGSRRWASPDRWDRPDRSRDQIFTRYDLLKKSTLSFLLCVSKLHILGSPTRPCSFSGHSFAISSNDQGEGERRGLVTQVAPSGVHAASKLSPGNSSFIKPSRSMMSMRVPSCV